VRGEETVINAEPPLIKVGNEETTLIEVTILSAAASMIGKDAKHGEETIIEARSLLD
jgi:hypothetical protein